MANANKTKRKTKEPIVICICGMAGSGKSTVARKLADRYCLEYYSGGDALKATALEKGYEDIERGWWESKEGMKFLKERDADHRFDKAIDRKLLDLAKRGGVVLDSWTMPWLLKGGFKIWLEASPETRAERISRRDGTRVEEALAALKSKEAKTKNIYKKLYSFSLGEDYQPFHLILDTDSLKGEEVFRVLCMVIDNCFSVHKINGKLGI
jgi:cytidylate kinase